MTSYVLAGGCFWCLDAVYRTICGVSDVVSGYTGGTTPAPTYEAVCTGTTGHAEAVRVRFDAAVVPPEVIMDLFFTGHDPTSLNRQETSAPRTSDSPGGSAATEIERRRDALVGRGMDEGNAEARVIDEIADELRNGRGIGLALLKDGPDRPAR